MEKGSRQELEQRLALSRPEDTLRGFFFKGALAAVRGLGDEVALNRCIEAAGGRRFMTFFCYPVGSLTRLLYAAAWALSERHGGFDAAMRYLGCQVAPEYLESGAGRVLVMMAGGEPRRMLDGFPSAYRTSIRHGECLVRWIGPANAIVVLKGSTLPAEYIEGAVQGMFEATKVADVKTTGRQVSLSETEVEVSW
ncbi:TIGR02265 family protein [Archangium sp.]|uniref:TIGR02265 family protein n=1 Tax=Archangium sp. TaxID=1872627 RepID=UPI002D452C57|nr:TIGR02265 family protein [Archangium sp.]HYO57797.1 TIGR02265 family protein [Archangium sp.]